MRLQEWKTDTSGGIEGLPLQLMIVILVATMGTAIIVGWMGSIETPQAIGDVQISQDTLEADDESSLGSITVTVTDQNGNLLPEATVILQGLNVRDAEGKSYAITNENGVATFTDLIITPSGSSSVGFISVLVTKSGYTESNDRRITVIL